MSYLKASTVKVKPEAESVICVCCSDMSLCSSDTFLKACQDLAVFPKPETRMSCNQSKTFIFYFVQYVTDMIYFVLTDSETCQV